MMIFLIDFYLAGGFKQKLKEFHIYQSGMYLKSRTTLDRRKVRYENFLKTLPNDKREMLVKLRSEFDKKTKERMERSEDADEDYQLIEDRNRLDLEHVTTMMNEIVHVEEK